MQIQDESYIKWKLFLEGNDEAYSWLYTHHIQLLYQYGLQITPDTEVIKDCIQDVFIRIYKNKNKLSIPQNVKIYLMISLKNSIYNVFSKERSEESYAFNFYSMEEQYITENDFINEEERREQINEIKKILHVLTPRQREIIYYRFIEEMEYDEILQNIKMRDKNDMEKEIGALKKAPDAVYIDSSNLSITQVKDKIIEIIKEKK